MLKTKQFLRLEFKETARRERTTVKWEYTTLMLAATGLILGGKVDAQKLNDRLNELGEEGWELVCIFDTNMLEGKTRDIIATLKRPSKA